MNIEIKEYDRIPYRILKKAKCEIYRLKANKTRLRKWKALQCKKGWYRLRLSRRYRLVVAIERIEAGPYEIMKHSTFDSKY